MIELNLNQISDIVKAEIQKQITSKSYKAKYTSQPQKDKQHQIALYELKILKRLFTHLGGDQQMESQAEMEVKIQLLQQNVVQLTEQSQKLNLEISQLKASNQQKSIAIQKNIKTIETLNKRSQLLDRMGGKIGFQKISTENNLLKQEIQKMKEKNTEYRQSIVELQSKLQIYKNINREQQLQIAQLSIQISSNQKQNRNCTNKGSTGLGSPNSAYQTTRYPITERRAQSPVKKVELMSLKQKNIELSRQNQKLRQQFEAREKEWEYREIEYAMTVKHLRANKDSSVKYIR